MSIENQNHLDGPPESATYGQILESSALIGGSSALTIVVGVVRTKAIALFLGPAGFGLFGVYASIISVAECLAGFGVGSSAIRQLAQSAGSGDAKQISRTAKVLLQVTLFLALMGAVLLAMLSRPIAIFTFGNAGQAGAVAFLSLAVFFELLSGGQRALLQGMRRVHALALSAIVVAALGLTVTVPLVYFLREKGVVPAIVATGLVAVLVTSYFRRKVRLEPTTLTRGQRLEETSSLLKLGFVFMTSYLMTTGAGYLIRIMVLRKIGYDANGLYQAAWTLGGVYVGFILQAMGTDFYPRLTAVAEDDEQCNRLVNEQTEVGLLLAGPGILATLALAPVVLLVFYSSKFVDAVGILRWICLGTLLQVVTWPMSYILVAKGKQALFFASEAIWAAASLGLAWFGIRWWGLIGVGVAFVGSYLVYGVLLLVIAGGLSGYRRSAANKRIGLIYVVLIAVVFAGFSLLPSIPAICLGVAAAVASMVYSVRTLVKLVASDRIPGSVRRLLKRVNLISSSAGQAG